MEGDVVKSFSANWSRSQLECQRVSVRGAENLHVPDELSSADICPEIQRRALSHETCSCRCGRSERERERQGSWI